MCTTEGNVSSINIIKNAMCYSLIAHFSVSSSSFLSILADQLLLQMPRFIQFPAILGHAPVFSVGLPLVFLWSFFNISYVFLWSSFGLPWVFLWSLFGLSLVSIGSSFGLPMVSLLSSLDLPLVSLLSFIGLPLVVLWSSLGLPFFLPVLLHCSTASLGSPHLLNMSQMSPSHSNISVIQFILQLENTSSF